MGLNPIGDVEGLGQVNLKCLSPGVLASSRLKVVVV